MACEIISLAAIHDISAVKKFLFPNEHVKTEADETEDWDVNWEWSDLDKNDGLSDESKYDDGWLQQCIISVSPASDSIVFANEDKIILLSAKWDGQGSDVETKYKITWKEKLSLNSYEYITSAICLPLASQKRSCHGGPDWTGIIVGFSSGNICMYTETGAPLLSQLLHTQPVMKLKCQTSSPSKNTNQAILADELMILYPSVVVTIDGFSLLQALRACRNQLARAAASGNDIIQPPPLACKKWGLNGQEKIVDFDSVGVVINNLFDQLQNASLIGGFYAAPKLAPTTSSLFLTSGTNPYVSFFYATEGYTTPIMSEIAIAMASNIKNALFSAASGLLGFASKAQPEDIKPLPKMEPAKKLPMRYCVPDHRRGDTITISPSRNLAAVTDNYGRIVLMDINRGIAVRIWKGYRDAQCAWLETKEDASKHDQRTPPRIALFLLIYAPRRGILEIWSAQQGPRVAAFNVTKCSRLLYTGCSMMGHRTSSAGFFMQPACCSCFLQPDGSIKTFDVPFHLALSDKSSKRARDLHLFKKMKMIIRNYQGDNEEQFSKPVTNLFCEMKTATIRQQALCKLITTSKISATVVSHVVTALIAQFANQDVQELDLESKLLVQQCNRIVQLLDLYDACLRCKQTAEDDQRRSSPQDFLGSLNLNEKQFQEAEQALVTHNTVSSCSNSHAKFSPKLISISKFLSCFNINDGHLERAVLQDSKYPIKLSSSEDGHHDLAALMFRSSILSCSIMSDFEQALSSSGVIFQELMVLLVTYWLEDSDMWKDWTTIVNFTSILRFLSQINCPEKSSYKSWESVCDKLTSSHNSPAAYTACLAVNSVVHTLVSHSSCNNNDVVVRLTQLQINLEDVLVLSSLLHLKINIAKRSHDVDKTINFLPISLKMLLNKGRGSVSEVVAQWMVHNKFNAETIWSISHLKKPEGDRSEIDEEQMQFLLELLKQVQVRFPNSMDYDSLLTNVCWENAVEWNKDPDVCSNMSAVTETLKFIASSLLRHGVTAMLWRMFVSKRFSATAFLIEMVRKTPKERLCRKNIGFGDVALEKFLRFSSDLLSFLLEANEPLGMETMPISGIDRLWNHRYQGPAPLIELAVTEKPTNSALVDRHHQLATVIYMAIVFKLKKVKPLSLFSSKTNNVFFKELDRDLNIPEDNVDLISVKLDFLAKVIVGVVRTFLECGAPPFTQDSCSMPSPSARDQSQATHWMGKVYELGQLWSIDGDKLKRIYICHLYSSGLDEQAERVIKSLSDSEVMSCQLMEILGMRLHHVIKESPNMTKKVAVLTPALSSWIKSLDESELRCRSVPADATYSLLVQIVNMSQETSAEYRRCMALKQVFQSIYKDTC